MRSHRLVQREHRALSGALIFLLAAAGALFLLAPAASADTNVGGAITVDTTWDLAGSPYRVLSSVSVTGTSGPDGVTSLVIDPGVQVLFNSGTSLTVGDNGGTPGALFANGTQALPILFTSNQTANKTRGFWTGVSLLDGASDTLTDLENITIEYAGGNGGLYLFNNHAPVRNVTVQQSSTYGLQLVGSTSAVENSRFLNNTQHGVYANGGTPTIRGSVLANNTQYGFFEQNAFPILVGNFYQGNVQRPLRTDIDGVLLDSIIAANGLPEVELSEPDGQANSDRTLQGLVDAANGTVIPYIMLNGVTVMGTEGDDLVTTLTLGPGVEFRFPQGSGGLAVGSTSCGWWDCTTTVGALVARGTELRPVRLTSTQPDGSKTAAWWYHLYFDDAANDTLSALENVTIESSGSVDDGGLYLNRAAPSALRNITVVLSGNLGVQVVDAPAQFENLRVDGAGRGSGYGVLISPGSSGRVTLANVTINNVSGRPLRMGPDTLISGPSMRNASIAEIEIAGGTLAFDTTWPAVLDAGNGTRYSNVLLGSVTIAGNDGSDNTTSLTLPPGAELRIAQNVQLAMGITSCSWSDCTYTPGALVARGTEAQPILLTSNQAPDAKTAGWWRNLYFDDASNDTVSVLENTTLEYGGSYADGVVNLYRAAPSFRGNLLRSNGDRALQINDAAVVVRDTVVQGSLSYGIFIQPATAGTRATLSNVTILDSAARPLRMSPDTWLDGLNVRNATVPEIEVYGNYGANVVRDAVWPRVVDAANGSVFVYVALNQVTINGNDGPDNLTTLTIQPGVEVRFAEGVGLQVGYYDYSTQVRNGALVARGTTAQPILLTTAQIPKYRAPGNWSGLTFSNYGNGTYSAVENTTIEYAGSQYYYYSSAGVTFASAPTFRNNIVRHSAAAGVFVDGAAVRIENTLITNNGRADPDYYDGLPSGFGVRIYGGYGSLGHAALINVTITNTTGRPALLSPDAFVQGLVLRNNSVPDVQIGDGTAATDATWRMFPDAATGQNLSLTVVGWVSVYGNDGADNLTTLTINPGTTIGFARYGGLEIGQFTWGGEALPGALRAVGTTSQPITLTSNATIKRPGDWWGIEFDPSTDPNATIFENVTVAYSEDGIYAYRSSFRFRNNVIRDSGSYGAYLDEAPARLENSLIVNTGSSYNDANNTFGVYIYNGYDPINRAELVGLEVRNTSGRALAIGPDTLLQNVTVRNGSIPEIQIDGGYAIRDATRDIHTDVATGKPLPYYVANSIYVSGRDGADNVTALTLRPGVEFQFDQGEGLYVGDWGDVPPGALVARGTAAQPVKFTSHQPAGQKTRGYWDSVGFWDSADDGVSALENVTFEYGGAYDAGQLYLGDAAPAVLRNLVVRENFDYGVYLESTPAKLENVLVTDTSGTYAYGVFASPWYDPSGLTLANVTIQNTTGTPLMMGPDADVQMLTLRNNSVPQVDVAAVDGYRDGRWIPLRDLATNAVVPYVVQGDATIRGHDGPDGVTTLTLFPGTEVRFVQGASLNIGTNDPDLSGGALRAVATQAQPIRFTSARPFGVRTAQDWGSINFYGQASSSATLLENVTIEYGGAYGQGAVHVEGAGPTLRNSVIRFTGPYSLTTQGDVGLQLLNDVFVRSDAGLLFQASQNLLLRSSRISATGATATLDGDTTGAVLRDNRFASGDGIFTVLGHGNTIVNNDFNRTAGGTPVWDDGSDNAWNLDDVEVLNILGGPWQGGNSYSDYPGYDLSNPFDGLADTDLPYLIPGSAGSSDDHPLVTQDRWRPAVGGPHTLLALAGNLTANAWYNTPVQVTMTGTDDDGFDFTIYWSLDGGSYDAYGAPFEVAADGFHQLRYYAIDDNGTFELPHRVNFKVDTTAPDLAIDVDDGVTEDLCFRLASDDATSGLATLTYSVLDGADQAVTNRTGAVLAFVQTLPGQARCADLLHDGVYRVVAQASDLASNGRGAATALLGRDVEGPAIVVQTPQIGQIYAGPLNFTAPVPTGFENESVIIVETDVVATADDVGSGPVMAELWVDGVRQGNATEQPYRWTLGPGLTLGYHNFTVRAFDAVGHHRDVRQPFFLVLDPLGLTKPPPSADEVAAAVNGTVANATAGLPAPALLPVCAPEDPGLPPVSDLGLPVEVPTAPAPPCADVPALSLQATPGLVPPAPEGPTAALAGLPSVGGSLPVTPDSTAAGGLNSAAPGNTLSPGDPSAGRIPAGVRN